VVLKYRLKRYNAFNNNEMKRRDRPSHKFLLTLQWSINAFPSECLIQFLREIWSAEQMFYFTNVDVAVLQNYCFLLIILIQQNILWYNKL